MRANFLSILALNLIIVISAQRRQCPDVCPAIYQPVKARCNGRIETFSNSCALGIRMCQRNDCVPLDSGNNGGPIPVEPPSRCPDICPAIYQPVRARCNGRIETFSNSCELSARMCKRNDCVPLDSGNNGGPIPVEPPSRCPDICPAIYQPVMARCRGRIETFSNSCELSARMCKRNDCVPIQGTRRRFPFVA